MVGRLVPIILAIAVSAILAFVAFGATGAPTAPTASFNTQLTPGAAQTLQVPIYTAVYSTVSPNSLGWIGNSIVYTATASLGNGAAPTVLASAQSQVVNLLSANGSAYVLGTTLTLSIPQLCSGAACIGYTENITITAYALVGLLSKAQSPTSVIVLSSSPNYRAIPPYPQPSPDLFYLELYGSLLAILSFDAWMAWAVVRHEGVLVLAIASTLVLIPMLVLWW
jgi:hypothetical protein